MRSDPTPAEPRTRVLEHLASIVELFPDLPIDAPPADGLSPRDAALLRAIDGAVRRRWLSLRGAVSSFLNRPFESLDPVPRAALLVGTAQLLLLDRIPDHATIDSAVEWTKRTQGKGVAGLVNAILRNVARRRDAASVRQLDSPQLASGELPLPDGRILADMLPHRPAPDRLSTQCSLAPSLVASWHAQAGEATALHRALCSIVPAPTIVRHDPDSPPTGLVAHERRGYSVYGNGVGALPELLDADGARWVQDPGAAAAVEMTASTSPARIVDLCAGRGTKTRQLMSLHQNADIVASDPDEARLATLRSAVGDDPRVTVTTDGEVDRLGAGADLVVVDVPCSNTAVLSRRLEARYRHDPARQAGLVALQREILARALGLVGPGGHVLYATCSLEPEENEHPWSEIARRLNREVTVVHSELREPQGLPGEPPTHHLDGGGTVLLRVMR